jgi:hypothetical protein
MDTVGRHLARAIGIAAAASVAIGSCGGSPAAPPTTPTAVASTTQVGCQAVSAGAGGPTTDPNGPYFHQVVVSRTADGVILTDLQQVLDHASVPDGARGRDGSTLIYYVNGAQGGVWVARLAAGSAAPIGPVTLNGVANPAGVVDPDATTLPDGRVRLVYLSNFNQAPDRPRTMCVADSSDGVNFQVVGPAITLTPGQGETDPSIVQLQDGGWLMAISRGQQTVMARSPDGLTYSAYATLGYGGVPELARLADGRIRLYVCSGGIKSYLSTDGGSSWTAEATVVRAGTLGKPIVCDPSMVAGTDVFIFKTGG